ncbi:MAG: sugar transferase [Hyphomicrobiaceae bacterium]
MSVTFRHEMFSDRRSINLGRRLDFIRASDRSVVEEILGRHLDRQGQPHHRYIGVTIAPVCWMLIGLVGQVAAAMDGGVKPATAEATAGNAVPHRALGGILKRTLDILLASAALIALAPIMLMTYVILRLTLGSPVFFSHTRIGLGGRPFSCYKYRSMVTNGDEVLRRHLDANPSARREWEENRKLRDDPRVTAFGRIMRKTSIDELPQLLNILKGDMSCVGPRPVVMAELSKYGPHARHYLRARPGLTGVWQVSGRSSTSYRQRVAMDTLYVRRWSMGLDVKIIVLTIPSMLKTDDAA